MEESDRKRKNIFGKMKKLKMIGICILCFLFTSCSCMRVLTGRLVDRQTLKPIYAADIQITNKGYEREFSSDSTGYFEAFLHGGCKCPRVKAGITAEGYTSINAIEPRERDTIILYMDQKTR